MEHQDRNAPRHQAARRPMGCEPTAAHLSSVRRSDGDLNVCRTVAYPDWGDASQRHPGVKRGWRPTRVTGTCAKTHRRTGAHRGLQFIFPVNRPVTAPFAFTWAARFSVMRWSSVVARS